MCKTRPNPAGKRLWRLGGGGLIGGPPLFVGGSVNFCKKLRVDSDGMNALIGFVGTPDFCKIGFNLSAGCRLNGGSGTKDLEEETARGIGTFESPQRGG